MTTKWLGFAMTAALAAACTGGGGSGDDDGPDAGESAGDPDAGATGPCAGVDCGAGAECDDSIGVPVCLCPGGSCGGGASCETAEGISMCVCPDGTAFQGGSCPATGSCPDGMVYVDRYTCIDATEATVNDFLIFLDGLGSACDDPGPTCTACGGQRCFPSDASNPWGYDDGWYIEGQVGLSLTHPARYVTFDAAKTACQSWGKRLCRPDEWQLACGGFGDRAFPYGSGYQEGLCRSSLGFGTRPDPVADNAQCVTVEHGDLYDLSGNVYEWVNDCNTYGCMARGGSYAVDGNFFPDALGCLADPRFDRDDTEYDMGFRCCATPQF